MENGPLLQLNSIGRYGPNSLWDTPADIYDDATEFRGNDMVGKVVEMMTRGYAKKGLKHGK